MAENLRPFVILLLSVAYAAANAGNHPASSNASYSCPLWQFYNNTPKSCECGNDIQGAVWCNETTKEVRLLNYYCMTLNQTNGQTVVGKCFFGCKGTFSIKDVYNRLPEGKSKLNDWLCGGLNKNGTSCGECKQGYSRVVYSYDLNCQKCTSSHSQNVAKFVAAAFGPLTLFYILVVVFKVSATSPQLTSYVLLSQYLSEPINARAVLRATQEFPKIDLIARILSSLYGIWNLDFFRGLYPPICLDVPALLVLALDYAGAFYSLFLIVLTYSLIKLHSNNVRVIVCLWASIKYVPTLYKKQWSTRLPMANVFSTFFLLSYVKLLSVSFTLLVPTTLYDIQGNSVGTVLYYESSIQYFGKEHTPYGIFAIAVLVILIIIPTLFLTLYPFKWFQCFLNCCRIKNVQAIHIVADCYLGWFKDGTERGTRDCRFVVTLHLGVRICIFAFYAISLNIYVYTFVAVILIISSIVLSLLKPYKEQWGIYNTIDPVMILLVPLWTCTALSISIASTEAFEFIQYSLILTTIAGILPLLYITSVIVIWLVKRCRTFIHVLKTKFRMKHGELEPLKDSSPVHRMEHPNQSGSVASNQTSYNAS